MNIRKQNTMQKILLLGVFALFVFLPQDTHALATAAISKLGPVNSGIIGWWTFDSANITTATATDRSGQANDGTRNGTLTSVNGKIGSAFNFNGSTGFVVATNTASLQVSNGTISAWIKTGNAGTSFRGIITKQIAYGMFLQDNEFGMFDWNASTWRGTGRLLNDNTWHHVACTFQSGVTNGTLCYIDGALATTTTMTIGNQLNGIAIGSGSTGGTQLFTGYIDDPRVYNRVLSAAEIAQLAGTSKIKVLAPTRGSLVGYWNLNDGIGTTARDTSGSGANGTFNGTPLWTTAKVGNSALTFNGTSQSVNTISSAALPTGTNPISVFAWIKTSTTSRETAFSYGSSATGQAVTLDVSQIGGNGHFWVDFYNTTADSGVTVNDGNWHYVGFSFAGNTTSVTLYVDGVPVSKTLANTPNIASGSNAQIGRWVTAGAGDTTPYYFSGSIDEVRVYSRTMTQTEVTTLYKSEQGAHANSVSRGQELGLKNGLVGWWTFDGKNMTTATATDMSGQGNDGTLQNTPVPMAGKLGSALRFDGVASYVSVLNSSSLQPQSGNWSVAFWIKRTGAGASDYPQVVGSRPWTATADKGWAVSYSTSNSKIGAHYADGSAGFDVTATQSSTTVPLNTWQHWVVVFDRTNSQLRYYLNGSLDITQTPSFPTAAINQTDALNMGREIGGSNARRLDAIVDDVRVYNRSLTTSEISQIYKLGGR